MAVYEGGTKIRVVCGAEQVHPLFVLSIVGESTRSYPTKYSKAIVFDIENSDY